MVICLANICERERERERERETPYRIFLSGPTKLSLVESIGASGYHLFIDLFHAGPSEYTLSDCLDHPQH